MTDFSRLYSYVYDRFPEISEADIGVWFRKNVPNWSKIPHKSQTSITRDWEAFTNKQKRGKKP